MDSLISENRGLLLLGVFASLGVLFFLRPDQPHPTLEENSATDSREELIEATPAPFNGISSTWN